MACLRCDDKIAIVNCVPFSPALPYIPLVVYTQSIPQGSQNARTFAYFLYYIRLVVYRY